MSASDDPLFDPRMVFSLEVDDALRQQILADNWFPSKKPKGARAKKGARITWLVESDARLVKVRPDQVVATHGNEFIAAKLGTFAKMMRQGAIPYAFVPYGYIDKVSATDVEETQGARPGDLAYDGMTRPFMKDELGKTIVRLNAGNHRAFAAFLAGEPYIWVAIPDKERHRNPARKEAVDAADFIVAWARAGDLEYIANVIEAELERFEKNANAPIIERAFRGLDATTQMSAKDLEDQSARNMGGARPVARAAAIRIVRAYGTVMGVPPQATNVGYIAQLIEMTLRGDLSRPRISPSRTNSACEALDFINETRRQRHQSPLDPDREGWTDDDLMVEQERLQKNPPSYEDALGLRELPQTLSAERLLKSPDLITDGRILSYFRGRTWAVRVAASSQEKAAALGRKIQKSLVSKRSLTASDPFFHDKRLIVIYDDGWVELPPAEASDADRLAARVEKQRVKDRTLVGKLLAKLIALGGAASIDTRDRAIWKIAESQGFVERITGTGIAGPGRYRITEDGRRASASTHRIANPVTEAEILEWYEDRLGEAQRLAAHLGIELRVGSDAHRELFGRYGLPGGASFEDLTWLGYADPMAASFGGKGPKRFSDGRTVVFWVADPREAVAKWLARSPNPHSLSTKARLLAW